MESRAHQAEQRWKEQNHSSEQFEEKSSRIFSIVRHLVSLFIPLRRRYLQLIDANRYLRQHSSRFDQIQRSFPFRPSAKNRFRIAVISILAFGRFRSFPSFVDERIVQTLNEQTFLNEDPTTINSLLNRLVPPIVKGSNKQFFSLLFSSTMFNSRSLIKLIASALPRSSVTKVIDSPSVHSHRHSRLF